jgi:hypothetical protein
LTDTNRHITDGNHLSFKIKVAAALVLAVMPAYSYADPGSGILIYQMIAAACVGALFYVRKLLIFFGLIGRKKG